jgi:hypothetical protein
VRAGVPSVRAERRSLKHAIRSLNPHERSLMYNIVYIVGAIVIVLAILSFVGLRG